ncbi:hypothetical protein Tco_0073120 [Tanacetum coccineum]
MMSPILISRPKIKESSKLVKNNCFKRLICTSAFTDSPLDLNRNQHSPRTVTAYVVQAVPQAPRFLPLKHGLVVEGMDQISHALSCRTNTHAVELNRRKYVEFVTGESVNEFTELREVRDRSETSSRLLDEKDSSHDCDGSEDVDYMLEAKYLRVVAGFNCEEDEKYLRISFGEVLFYLAVNNVLSIECNNGLFDMEMALVIITKLWAPSHRRKLIVSSFMLTFNLEDLSTTSNCSYCSLSQSMLLDVPRASSILLDTRGQDLSYFKIPKNSFYSNKVGFLGVSLVPSTKTCGKLDIKSASCKVHQ